MRATQYHENAAFVQLNRDTTNNDPNSDGGLFLSSNAGQLYWNLSSTVRVTLGFNPMIELGAVPYGNEWTHLAIQITAGTPYQAGTQVVSAWRDGQPITAFYKGYTTSPPSQKGPLQTGLTWEGKGGFTNINSFTMGAPLRASIGTSTGFNSSVGYPFVDIQVDDIQIRSDAPYTDLQPFTPGPVTWGGNVTQMVTGI
jgi:hypothetical protein